jgi:predicted nucleic acid binding AN1-type Zn finger protein
MKTATTDAAAAPSSAGIALKAKTRKTTKARCGAEACRKRLGLHAFVCKCGGVYCGAHRHEDGHACRFDYATTAARLPPAVVAERVARI